MFSVIYFYKEDDSDLDRTSFEANAMVGIAVGRSTKTNTLSVYNPTTKGRYPLRVGVSKDNGETWPIHIDLEVKPGKASRLQEFSYPAVIPWPASQEEEGVSITYTWNRQRVAFFSSSLKDIEARAATAAEQ